MIRFTKTGTNGRLLVGFGLSAENIKRLKKGDHILFDGETMNIKDTDFFIFSGDTEEEMEKWVNENLGGQHEATDTDTSSSHKHEPQG
jgi:ASC-1-like (ASCH) protein